MKKKIKCPKCNSTHVTVTKFLKMICCECENCGNYWEES